MTRIILLTGLAGAGRTTAADIFEDMGFFVMENLPAEIVNDVIVGMRDKNNESKLAVAVDLRDRKSIETLIDTRDKLRAKGEIVDIVFLDADDDTIIRRFEQTRRPHPYISAGVLSKGIELERELLSDMKAECDVHIDTTTTNPTQLSQQLDTLFSTEVKGTTIVVNSFGFKYGAPRDSDFIFDVRFLPNPFWEPDLKESTGLEPEVQNHVRSFEKYDEYIESLEKILKVSFDEFSKLGKGFVTVAFGCTGGYHRSVTVATDIANWLRKEGYKVIVVHRELDGIDFE